MNTNVLLRLVFFILLFRLSYAAQSSNSIIFQINNKCILFNSKTLESVSLIEETNQFVQLNLTFKPSTTKEMKNVTQENINKKAELIYNGTIISDSIVSGVIDAKELAISGVPKLKAQKFIKSFIKSKNEVIVQSDNSNKILLQPDVTRKALQNALNHSKKK